MHLASFPPSIRSDRRRKQARGARHPENRRGTKSLGLFVLPRLPSCYSSSASLRPISTPMADAIIKSTRPAAGIAQTMQSLHVGVQVLHPSSRGWNRTSVPANTAAFQPTQSPEQPSSTAWMKLMILVMARYGIAAVISPATASGRVGRTLDCASSFCQVRLPSRISPKRCTRI